jgi:uncharacterized protein YecE (DUF72 family)
MAGRIVVGTSSWADPGFVDAWYPPGLAARDRLRWYAGHFDGVEVNSTWYALPAERTVARWVDETPDGFRFDVKLHRLLTRHAADAKSLPADLRERARTGPRGRVQLEPGMEAALLERTWEAVGPLREAGRLSSFLLQLSPAFDPRGHELAELRAVVDGLAPVPVAIELRHRRWLEGDRARQTLAELEAMGAVHVAVDAPADPKAPTTVPPVDAVTNPVLAYLRLHGRDREAYLRGRSVAERFGYRYGDDELREVGERAQQLAGEAQEVRMMFNNNRGDDAPVAAERMRALLGQTATA